MHKFYDVLDLCITQPSQNSCEELSDRLWERNYHHRTTIKKFLRRYEKYSLRAKNVLSLSMSLNHQTARKASVKNDSLIRRSTGESDPKQK